MTEGETIQDDSDSQEPDELPSGVAQEMLDLVIQKHTEYLKKKKEKKLRQKNLKPERVSASSASHLTPSRAQEWRVPSRGPGFPT